MILVVKTIKHTFIMIVLMLFHVDLTLVFTSDGAIVRVIIRRVECYDLVKIKPTESEAEH